MFFKGVVQKIAIFEAVYLGYVQKLAFYCAYLSQSLYTLNDKRATLYFWVTLLYNLTVAELDAINFTTLALLQPLPRRRGLQGSSCARGVP